MSRTIHRIELLDVDEQYAPPEQVVSLGMVNHLLHIEIAKYDETHVTTSTERVAGVCVDARSFYDAFITLWTDEFRPPVKLGESYEQPSFNPRPSAQTAADKKSTKKK